MATAVLYSQKMRDYDLGHVLKGDRYERFMHLFRSKIGDEVGIDVVEPDYATDADLKLVHTEDYIRRVERCESRDPADTPLTPSVVRAARLMAGAGRLGADLVASGQYEKTVSIGGGVQHAGRDYEKGFGIFSDVGICAETLLRRYDAQRVFVLDADAHAGDGIYGIFSRDSRVLFMSVHQDPQTLYPGPGYRNPVGEGEGAGYSVNVPLPPGASDAAYAHVLDELFVPLAETFRPDVLLLVDGSDTHFSDAITQMGLTLEGIRMISSKVREAAARLCYDRVISFDGSGYDRQGLLYPRGWLASICGLTGIDLPLEEPYPLPAGHAPDAGLAETRRVVDAVKDRLSTWWHCFSA
ncbi:MAG: hypothetical protein ACOC6A_07010 [Chloroflexota bacterium]